MREIERETDRQRKREIEGEDKDIERQFKTDKERD